MTPVIPSTAIEKLVALKTVELTALARAELPGVCVYLKSDTATMNLISLSSTNQGAPPSVVVGLSVQFNCDRCPMICLGGQRDLMGSLAWRTISSIIYEGLSNLPRTEKPLPPRYGSTSSVVNLTTSQSTAVTSHQPAPTMSSSLAKCRSLERLYKQDCL